MSASGNIVSACPNGGQLIFVQQVSVLTRSHTLTGAKLPFLPIVVRSDLCYCESG